MTYLDKFEIEVDDFLLENYFRVKLETLDNISKEDFFLGIIPFEGKLGDGDAKTILRLKAIRKEDRKLVYTLQSICLIRNLSLSIKGNELEIHLNKAHAVIEHFFVEFLTDDFKQKIGLEIEESG